jgi:hypothetical protein
LTEEEFVKKLSEKLPLSIDGLEVISCTTMHLLIEYKSDRNIFNYNEEYKNYVNNPDSIDEIYANIKSAFLSREELIKVNPEQILPRIKNKQFIKERVEGNSGMENVIYQQINEELVVLFVEQRENKFYPIQKSDLVDLNYSIEELFLKASTNLANLPNIGTRNTDGLIRIIAGGLYESSFILLDLLLRKEFSVSGHIIVALPTRDTFLLQGVKIKKISLSFMTL